MSWLDMLRRKMLCFFVRDEATLDSGTSEAGGNVGIDVHVQQLRYDGSSTEPRPETWIDGSGCYFRNFTTTGGKSNPTVSYTQSSAFLFDRARSAAYEVL